MDAHTLTGKWISFNKASKSSKLYLLNKNSLCKHYKKNLFLETLFLVFDDKSAWYVISVKLWWSHDKSYLVETRIEDLKPHSVKNILF